jgi:hypothetical protein
LWVRCVIATIFLMVRLSGFCALHRRTNDRQVCRQLNSFFAAGFRGPDLAASDLAVVVPLFS